MELSDGVVTISKREYHELLNDSIFLDCLRQGGVDNWEWYDEAVNQFTERSVD